VGERENMCKNSLIMKKAVLFTFAVIYLSSLSLFAQMDTIWFDSNWKKTSKNKASYYRCHCVKKANGYWFTDYYISGAKQMEGLSLEKGNEVFQGPVKWYFENGNVFQIVTYKNGVLFGSRKVYNENGKLKSETIYKNGKMDGPWKEYYENGKLHVTGAYEKGEKEGVWKTYCENGKLKEEGKYVFDRKVDVWKTYYYDGTDQK
jgi:antitoxin component YwqK of YwqJK toxin-antitoxin module